MLFGRAFLSESAGHDDYEALVTSVEYHLTRMLNSEAPLMGLPARLGQVEKSNLRFGLDNLQSISSQMDKDQFARHIENWVKGFEPRLSEVTVEVYERDELRNCINFSLLARLKTDRGAHALAFDSNINLTDQKVEVEGQDLD